MNLLLVYNLSYFMTEKKTNFITVTFPAFHFYRVLYADPFLLTLLAEDNNGHVPAFHHSLAQHLIAGVALHRHHHRPFQTELLAGCGQYIIVKHEQTTGGL